MKRISDVYELSTGRKIYANRGLLSLDPIQREPYETRLYEGYDGSIDQGALRQPEGDDEAYLAECPQQCILTAAERDEIARFMIELWSEWGKVDIHQM